ncbi:DUF2125 domain-containing protein [Fuscibacter oryzae]|uniref:DUF2125 domain-containing protein n=1 Tax=Fuscibacter oryzae TaxID=2803939 RepID=A0A8J7MT40_9RHOB|nr:DUF2125 domain-containing protein [Fuscibacter oryzae]MBL4929137.1 DUF2125 domain-containing protein [Fuscibacter oryzae]
MKHWSLAASTATLALFAGYAQADVTPDQVWQNWQDMSASMGQTLTVGSTKTEGGALVVTDLKAVTGKDGSKVETALGEVRLTDKGDGTVEITMSDSYTVAMNFPPSGSDPAKSAEILISQPGMAIVASGTPEATDYAFSAPKMELTLSKLDGKDAVAEGTNVQATLANVAGHYLVAPEGTSKKLDSQLTADSLSIAVKGKDPENNSDVDLTASVSGLTAKGTGVLAGMENKELSDALKAGFAVESTLTYGAVAYTVNVVDAQGPSKIVGSSQGGSLQVAMDAARLLLDAQGKGVQLAISGPTIPLPEVSLSYAESGFKFLIPVEKSETPQDYGFAVKLVDLSLSNDIWGMIDPTAQLPHDPATVILDTKGTATLTHDLMNQTEMAALGEAPPGQLNSLDLTQILAKVAGAELTGAGAFTFDNTDMTTYQGMPAPTGKIDLKLVGGNALLDKLVAMGLISSDDAMGARMMLSMFAKAGAGQDELTSTLEFKDKHFYANGQQLQ